ncbi:hypothetical protein Q0Z83_042180 [Actinoplanes sichuanensis]|nr:hypothetical protein Q0Z83_042180 [Actinoplanes sichuanensis]
MLGKALAEHAGRQPPQLTAQILTAYGTTIGAGTMALEDLLMRLGRLAEDQPAIAELAVSLLLDTFRGQGLAGDGGDRPVPVR